MSGPIAIAGVTAALKDLLNDGLLDHDLASIGSFAVTSLPPDRITTGATEPNQLNLFLYQVTPNLGWRNTYLPSRDVNGGRLTNPPLALDLHYLLTAYGSQDLNAEILLGYAMQLMHETPVLTREQLRIVLNPPIPVDGVAIPGIFGNLSAADLADQVELLKITPNYLSADDLTKMWSAMQARYRPSVAYTVSVVLIQATNPTHEALPVLKRGASDQGVLTTTAPFPVLTMVRSALSEQMPAARLGDNLLISGSNLVNQGSLTAVLSNAQAGLSRELPTTQGDIAGTLLVHLPSIAERAEAINEWAAGMITVALRVELPDLPAVLSNSVPFALAPRISMSAPADPAGYVVGETITLECSPRLQARQQAECRVILGSRTITPDSIDTPVDPLLPTSVTFKVPAIDAGSYVLRLRADGIDSLPVTVSGSPPKLDFDPTQKVKVL